jgi:hypothetical protein
MLQCTMGYIFVNFRNTSIYNAAHKISDVRGRRSAAENASHKCALTAVAKIYLMEVTAVSITCTGA